MKAGEPVRPNDPEYPKLEQAFYQARKITSKLNSSFHEDYEIRDIFSELTGSKVDSSFRLIPPFYTDSG